MNYVHYLPLWLGNYTLILPCISQLFVAINHITSLFRIFQYRKHNIIVILLI